MDLLLAGLILWSGTHYIPGFLPEVKAKLILKLGNSYRGVFSLLIVTSIVLMVMGWRASAPEMIYEVQDWSAMVSRLLMFVSLYLFGSAHSQVNIKRIIRHPMLSGVIVWGIAHLVSNGDSRSVILFGGMIIWAVSEILIINKRDGEWVKMEPVPLMNDVKVFAIALVVYFILGFAHPYIAGVAVM